MRVLVVGDLHGTVMGATMTVELAKRLEVDEVWQAGDLGYWPRMKSKRRAEFFGTLDKLPVNLYFADGNHEDHEALAHPRSGESLHARQLSKRVFHQPRGSVRAIYNTRVLFFGGAHSVDQDSRVEGVSWFRNEVPNAAEWRTALEAGEVDAIVSHDAPSIVDFHYPPHSAAFWPRDILEKSDRFRAGLTEILLPSAKPGFWFHGHHHKMKLSRHHHYFGQTQIFSLSHDGYRGTFAVYDLEKQFAHFVGLKDGKVIALSPTRPKHQGRRSDTTSR